ncbi:hypothetical protein pb186bvf_014321 [Paramecium bursaria]
MKRDTLILLGRERLPSAINPKLLEDHPQLFTNDYQIPQLLQKTEHDSSILISQATPNIPQPKKKKTNRAFFPQKWSIQKNNLSPFSFSKQANFQSITNRYWYYLDNENTIQGPFNCLEMDNWYRKNLLDQSLLISYRQYDLTSFIKLRDMLQETQKEIYPCQVFRRSKSLSKLQSIQSPGRESTEASYSNNNSCQKYRVWGQDNSLSKAIIQDFLWIV